MAQRVQIVLEDDLDGGVAAETVTFGLDGVSYEIDLSDKNAGKLRDEFASWIGHARRSGGRRPPGRRSAGAARERPGPGAPRGAAMRAVPADAARPAAVRRAAPRVGRVDVTCPRYAPG